MVRDSAKKIDLANLLQDFLSEWPSQYVQSKDSSEWKKATDEAWLIIKYTIKWTRFEPDTFLAGEILDAFRKLRPNIKINEENIRNGSINVKIKDILNKEDSNLSKTLQGWLDEIKGHKNIFVIQSKKAIKEICESTEIRGKYNQGELACINEFGFVGSDGQGKYCINDFYKRNSVLKSFIDSPTPAPVKYSPRKISLFTFPLWIGSLFWQLWQLLLLVHPQPTIAELCSKYKDNGSISCSNSEFGDTIASNNEAVKLGIKGEKWRDDQVYVIAVVVPDENAPPFITENMLRGVAAQQSQFNGKSKISKIIVLIAKESPNSKDQKGVRTAGGGVEIAKELVKQTRILGVVGPYSSPSLVNVINSYCTKNLALVSPTASALIGDINQIYKQSFSKGKQNPSTKCFFRPTGTNDTSADSVFNHLVSEKYQKIFVLKENDAFADSWLSNFKAKNTQNKLSLEGDDKPRLSERTSVIKNQVEVWKNNLNPNEKSAILLIKGPKMKDENNIVVEAVLEANKGKSIIVATNPAYSPTLLDELRKNRNLDNKSIESMIISVPWFKPNLDKKTDDEDWFYGMSHDATVLLTEAISKEVEAKNNLTRQGVYQRFQAGLGSIGKNRTVTGEITLVGNDRKPTSYDLIQPKSQNNKWVWIKL